MTTDLFGDNNLNLNDKQQHLLNDVVETGSLINNNNNELLKGGEEVNDDDDDESVIIINTSEHIKVENKVNLETTATALESKTLVLIKEEEEEEKSIINSSINNNNNNYNKIINNNNDMIDNDNKLYSINEENCLLNIMNTNKVSFFFFSQ
jgi:hypothetical protein